jgi:putative addiction module killer protein
MSRSQMSRRTRGFCSDAGPRQSDAAARNDAFLDRRAGGVQAVVNAILARRLSVIYSSYVTEVRQTPIFREWLGGLGDRRAVERIAQRIVRLQSGLIGDGKPVGGGVCGLRIDYGPGYRVYFVQRGQVLITLLCGGNKRSQSRDISRAKALAAELEDD